MTSSTDFKLYSHPKLLLRDHLWQSCFMGLKAFDDNGIFSEYRNLLKVILIFHDLGKASSYFQNYLLRDGARSDLSRHSEISALWASYYCLKHQNMEPLPALFAYITIACHHKNLGNIREMLIGDLSNEKLLQISEAIDYTELNRILNPHDFGLKLSHQLFTELLNYFQTNSLNRLYRKISKQIQDHHWLLLNYLFSLLIWADKYSAIFQNQSENRIHRQWQDSYPDAFKNTFENTGRSIDLIRNEAYEALPKALQDGAKLYSINMPTGSGKTLASLKLALSLKKKEPHYQRIVYALPFTSVIDQNHQVFSNILKHNDIQINSATLLAHHHLADYTYKSDSEYTQNESEYLVETWDSELVVTTFVQLMASFLSAKNNSLKRFHRLANSIIILDEVQNIPHHFWPLLKHCFQQLSTHLNAAIILVTATLPMIFDPQSADLIELAKNKQKWFEALDRIELDYQGLDTPINLEELADLLCSDYHQNPKLKRLVILNTVQSSLDLFQIIKARLPNEKVIYLSSNVVPSHRLQRIETIKKHKNKALFIISTQVVEAGVDIDVDVVYRDLAPLDSIIQASGRCNRNGGKSRSRVILFQLVKEGRKYWNYVYDSTLVAGSEKVLKEMSNPITEPNFYKLNENYFKHLNEVSAQDRSRQIIKSLSRLEYESALDYHPQNNPLAFCLIESHPSQSVFVECDDDSSQLYQEYLQLKAQDNSDFFAKRAQMKDQFRKMGAYIINVAKPYVNCEDPVFFVDQDSLNLYYDLETGFKREAKQEDYIF